MISSFQCQGNSTKVHQRAGGKGGREGRLSIRKRHFTEQVVGTRNM